MVIDDHNTTELDRLQGKKNKVIDLAKPEVVKGPHFHGAFITGDFLSETVTKFNRAPSMIPMPIAIADPDTSEKSMAFQQKPETIELDEEVP